jgi:hypothetical protein
LALEDGPEPETSKKSPVQSDDDHDDVLEGMYTSDMLDEKGYQVLERAVMTEDQERRLREHGAGGSSTVSVVGVSSDLSRQCSIKVRPVNVSTFGWHKIGAEIERTYGEVAVRPAVCRAARPAVEPRSLMGVPK